MKYGLGWVRDLPDHRDRYLKFSRFSRASLTRPSKVDLRYLMPDVYDQGELGSCTAQAIAALVESFRIKSHQPVFQPSRLFIYYNERERMGTVDSDSGAMIRIGIQSVAEQGVCSEDMWDYDTKRFAKKPLRLCYREAEKFQVLEYARIEQNLVSMQTCLASGLPFVFGFSVYENIIDAFHDGQIRKPEGLLIGGHAVLCVGYDEANNNFIFRNSWGTSWGSAGYGYLPYEYLTNPDLADDFWTISKME